MDLVAKTRRLRLGREGVTREEVGLNPREAPPLRAGSYMQPKTAIGFMAFATEALAPFLLAVSHGAFENLGNKFSNRRLHMFEHHGGFDPSMT